MSLHATMDELRRSAEWRKWEDMRPLVGHAVIGYIRVARSLMRQGATRATFLAQFKHAPEHIRFLAWQAALQPCVATYMPNGLDPASRAGGETSL